MSNGTRRQISPSDLILAARQGDLQTLASLITLDGSAAGKADSRGETALQIAAHKGSLEMCSLLLDGGALAVIDLGTPTERLTPLHLACSRGHASVADLLIKKGAKVDILDAKSYSALHHAAFKGNSEIVSLLLEAMRHRRCNTVAAVGQDGSKIETPLSLAAFMRHSDIVLQLVHEGDAQAAFVSNASDKAWVEQLVAQSQPAKLPSVLVRGSDTSAPSSPSAQAAVLAGSSPSPLSMGSSSGPSSPQSTGGYSGALRPTSRGVLRSSLRSPNSPRHKTSPKMPVFAPPAPLFDQDDTEVLRRRATEVTASMPPESPIWFKIHKEVPSGLEENLKRTKDKLDDLSVQAASGEEGTLYHSLLRRQSGSLPQVVKGQGSPGSQVVGSTGGPPFNSDHVLQLFPLRYLGLSDGLLIDQDMHFVFYLDPNQQLAAIEAQELPDDPLPFAPDFVGLWEASAGGGLGEKDHLQGHIRPLRHASHCRQMEQINCSSLGAKRSLRHAGIVASWLHARSGVLAEFRGGQASDERASLLVPLCGLLGLHEVRC